MACWACVQPPLADQNPPHGSSSHLRHWRWIARGASLRFRKTACMPLSISRIVEIVEIPILIPSATVCACNMFDACFFTINKLNLRVECNTGTHSTTSRYEYEHHRIGKDGAGVRGVVVAAVAAAVLLQLLLAAVQGDGGGRRRRRRTGGPGSAVREKCRLVRPSAPRRGLTPDDSTTFLTPQPLRRRPSAALPG